MNPLLRALFAVCVFTLFGFSASTASASPVQMPSALDDLRERTVVLVKHGGNHQGRGHRGGGQRANRRGGGQRARRQGGGGQRAQRQGGGGQRAQRQGGGGQRAQRQGGGGQRAQRHGGGGQRAQRHGGGHRAQRHGGGHNKKHHYRRHAGNHHYGNHHRRHGIYYYWNWPAAYRHGHHACHTVYWDGYDYDRPVRWGGTQCYDRYGNPYIARNSQFVAVAYY